MAAGHTGGSSESFDDGKFEAAFQAMLQMEKKDYPSYIGGLKVASGNDFPVNSPIDSSITFGRFQEPERGIASAAVEAAAKAFIGWSALPASERTACFVRALEVLRAQRYKLAASVLLSTGMTKRESLAEADRLIEVVSKECAVAEYGNRKPTGVWGVISTHNSPLASPAGYAAAAMLAGNTAVVAPSGLCPLPVYIFYSILESAGLPDGVLNLIVDSRDETHTELAENMELAGLVASGSGKNMEDMMFLQVDDELRFVNEIKGMNPFIVHRPSDIKKAAKDIVDSAFVCAGQRLYSTSKAIVTADSQQKFTDAVLEYVRTVTVGDPADDAVAGPLISGKKMKEFFSLIESARGRVIFGGKQVKGEFTSNGNYVAPAVIAGSDDDS
ncbi:MAG: aldehyde dehydrogenase family protein, partial [Candidatus Methanoplasma sp.]|nr:aldehyde dehydrogenase family protein [Candidatus Methanoplasma sp.]